MAVDSLLEENESAGAELDDTDIIVTKLVREKFGFDLNCYKQSIRKRRIERFMQLELLKSVEHLCSLFETDQGAFHRFINTFTISTTELFRDPSFYVAFKRIIVPYLKSSFTHKIWHIGCSSGEEVFSMGIFLEENGLLDESILYGTDIDQIEVNNARKGIVRTASLLKAFENYNVAEGRLTLSDHWSVGKKYSKLHDELLKRMIFSSHNLLTDSSFGEMDIISLKNVLIYFEQASKNKILRLAWSSLKPLGYLCLGSKESLTGTDVEKLFEVIDRPNRIYRKKLSSKIQHL